MNSEVDGTILIGIPKGPFVVIGYSTEHLEDWREPKQHEIIKRNVRHGTTPKCQLGRYIIHLLQSYKHVNVLYPTEHSIRIRLLKESIHEL